MSNRELPGWKKLVDGYPWLSREGGYPISAYSEFMPPPRLGRRSYTEIDHSLFSEEDVFGWHVSEIEEEYELRPGLENLARKIGSEIVELGEGKPAFRIAGHTGRNLENNPYWPPELAERAGNLFHERYVTFLPLALSRTQDDKGRLRWTFFGGSEQGPERAFWKSFYSAPGQEKPSDEARIFISQLLMQVYGEDCNDTQDLYSKGFRIFSSELDSRFPYWHESSLPSWTQSFLWNEGSSLDGARYLLTFQPFSRLPPDVRRGYLSGQIKLLPFPGSLSFWGMPSYIKLQESMPMAMQLPLQRLAARHGGPHGIRIPQSGWFHEKSADIPLPQVHSKLLLNTYKRTSRWDRARRYEDEVVLSTIEDSIGRTLFSTQLEVMGLYGKPMARNSQLWTADSSLLLDGPNATIEDLEKASRAIAEGGTFHCRFHFPAMRVGLYELYWQRPLIAYLSGQNNGIELLKYSPTGYLTGYLPENPNLENPVELWPRMPKRDSYMKAIKNFEHLKEHYTHQTSFNIIRLLDVARRWGQKPVPRSLARQILRLPEREPLESWLSALPGKAENTEEGNELRKILEQSLEPAQSSEPYSSIPGVPPLTGVSSPITYSQTASREFEEAWWDDVRKLSQGELTNRDNADCVQDPVTQASLSHRHRDLERMGDYLLGRHRVAILNAGMEGRAFCGELPFFWNTDFDFSLFGGWKNNQERHTHERDIVVVIPGNYHNEAVVMADHYDTAYMEDVYEKSRGGTGARIAAAGADDNCSATAALLQAAPIFLKLSREGRLKKDIWLVHLTGEEFPADCMGARHLAQSLVEKTLRLHLGGGEVADLSGTLVAGVFVLDMIGHNRDSDLDEFQISPGKGRVSLGLAWQAHVANALWNEEARIRNQSSERRGRGRSKRSADGLQIPQVAEFLRLQGEVRLNEDPRSSLFNTDGQIFSDSGIPVVLFMENYDINRSGYHDTKDTMENIDLDYGAALAAIAVETVARVAVGEESSVA